MQPEDEAAYRLSEKDVVIDPVEQSAASDGVPIRELSKKLK